MRMTSSVRSAKRSLALAASLAIVLAASANDASTEPAEEKSDVPQKSLEFTATEGTWISLDVAPDGRTVVFDLLGHLYEMPVAGGNAKPLTTGKSWNLFPRYSPDGTQILFTSDRGGSEDLWVMNRADNSLKNISGMELPVFQGTWSRDGRHVFGTALNLRVRFPAYQFNFFGDRQELIPAGDRTPLNHFQAHPANGLLYFEHNDQRLYRSGARIKTYDTRTGEIAVYIERPGGACNPALSPDGSKLAYVHRDDRKTVLVVHDLATRTERVVNRELDFDRQDSRSFYGAYANMAWHPNGREIFVSYQGSIHAVDAATGASRDIPFSAPVRRQIDATLREKVDVPTSKATTQSHRWGQPTPDGILFEALGDLYLKSGSRTRNLTKSDAHETNPVYDAGSGNVYFASWTDDALGGVFKMSLNGKNREKLSSRASQYGAIAISAGGEMVAYLRGDGRLMNGLRLERQTGFELVVRGADGAEKKLTDISWTGNRYGKRPPTIRFDEEQTGVYFTEYEDDALTLKHMLLNGRGERTLYTFSHATRAVLSPTFEWVAFREYHRSYVTPFEYAGKPVTISAADGDGFCRRVDARSDGDFMEWTADGAALYWTRGGAFYRKTLASILNGDGTAEPEQLAFEYDLDVPQSTIALTNVRVITMNKQRDVLENQTVLVKNNMIAAIGAGATIPEDARVIDLAGHTIMPGMFDAHGHYGSPISALNVIEQNLYGLEANLAYGVTTMYDVYGTTQKDFWVSDMLRKGAIDGPRIFSVGDPIFVTKYRTKMHRSIKSLEDAEEHVRFNMDHGARAVKDYSNHTRAARQHLIAACRKLGINLISESFGNPQMNMTQVVDGFTGLEHTMGLEPLYDDVIRLFGASEIGITPTLVVVYNGPSGETWFHQRERLWEDKKLLNFFTKEELLRLRRPGHYWPDDHYAAQMGPALHKLYKAGTLMQMGAHGQMMGLGAHWEMELFVHGGFSPLEALEIATINGFTHQGLDHILGSIEPGKLADLVILRQNPLEDIRNSRSIAQVMKNGVLYDGNNGARLYPDPSPATRLYFQPTDRRD